MKQISFSQTYTAPKTKASNERAALIEPFVKRLQANTAPYKPMSTARICMYMKYIDTDDLHAFYKKLDDSPNFGAIWNWHCVAKDLN